MQLFEGLQEVLRVGENACQELHHVGRGDIISEIEQLERQFNIRTRSFPAPEVLEKENEEESFRQEANLILDTIPEEYKKFVQVEKNMISNAGNTKADPDKLQHCYTCSGKR